MASIIQGFEYDIFISYRQKDNKHDGWVTEFVDNLKGELEATFKEDISIYFDENPHDGLLETHSVDKSLKGKLKCLIFIPIISQTYCDSKSFAWQHELVAFNEMSKEDQFGRDIKLAGGNVASRILPIKIHDLDPEDKTLLENELGGILRCVEFIYKSAGVNRPLRVNEDHPQENLNKTYYRDQINKTANAVKEIIASLKKQKHHAGEVTKQEFELKPAYQKNPRTKIIAGSLILFVLIALGYFFLPKLLKSSEKLDKSVAVLPFTNLSNDPEQEYFSDGMVDAILDYLFKIGDLKVIARTSTMRYKDTNLTLKEIAHELNVSALLEGSVQRIGNKVRITTQLIDPKTGFHLWSETFDRDISDVFSIQTEVAQNVARELKSALAYKETNLIKNETQTNNQIAYDAYLKGNNYSSRYETFRAVEMYTKAIQEDPLFAVAYARRAKEYLYLYWIKDEELQDHELKAQEDIKKGLSINPELPELKIAQAYYSYWVNRDYDNALEIVTELMKVSPNMASLYQISSAVLRRQGKWDESIIEGEREIQLDPYNASIISELANTYKLIHQYDKVIQLCKKGLSLIPDNEDFKGKIFSAFISKTADLNGALNESGLTEADLPYRVLYYKRQYGKLIEIIRNDTTSQFDKQFDFHPKTYDIALIYFLNGNTSFSKTYADSAITILKEKLKETPNDERYYATLGKCYALIGNDEEAISCGKRAVELKPIKLDAWQGVVKEEDLMEIYILTGNYDMALNKIEFLISTPSALSVGELMIDPLFDNLRNLPRFQKIIDSAQKQLKEK
jgi:TolB-like protein/Flp pilus assembly protein TadD